MMFCRDCNQNYPSGDKYCLVCGCEMRADLDPSSSIVIQTNELVLSRFLDLFGIHLRTDIDFFLQNNSPKVLSPEFAASLSKIVVDSIGVIFWNCQINVGPLKINAVSSDFGSLPFAPILSLQIAAANPIYGEHELVITTEPSIIVFKRGLVPFAEKVRRALQSGAEVVIISQEGNNWPFIMTDSTSDDRVKSRIPVLMVKQSDGDLLLKLLASSPRTLSDASVTCSESSRDCAICHDIMAVGHSVIKLPCTHIYHDTCVMTWLQHHNTCPVCRHELPYTSAPGPPPLQEARSERHIAQEYVV
jgi:hypothetical protein